LPERTRYRHQPLAGREAALHFEAALRFEAALHFEAAQHFVPARPIVWVQTAQLHAWLRLQADLV
jgi:hypothetical protein